MEEMRQARRIILEKRDNIGDFVLATTFLNEAYRQWREREVTLVCSPAGEELARLMYPAWKLRVMPIAAEPGHYRGSWRKPGELQNQVRAWPKADLLINLRAIRHQFEMFFSSWVPAESKLAVQNRFHYEEGQYIKVPDRRVFSHVAQAPGESIPGVCKDIANHRALIAMLFPEVKVENAWPVLDFRAQTKPFEETAAAKGALAPDCLVLVPFPSGAIKRYPEDKLCAVASRLAQKHGLWIAIVGGDKDREEAETLRLALSAPKGVKNLAGVLSIPELVVAIRGARLVLGVDTGPMHIAVASGVRTVVLLGGGHYGIFGPWGDPRRARWLSYPMACYDCSWICSQAEPYCVRRIDPAAILEAADAMLAC
jgi:ADP-heptose:LPS heptosyltransferase